MNLVITSELHHQTAGSPRLERLVSSLCKYEEVYIIDATSFWKVKIVSFKNVDEFTNYRKVIKADSNKYVNGSRVGRLNFIFRLVKHFFLADLIKPSVLYFIFYLYNKKISKVVVSSPGFYNVILGFLVNKLNDNCALWVDMRDEWSLHKHIHFHKRIRRYIEFKILSSAQIVTSVSKTICKNLVKQHSLNNVRLLYNFDDSKITLKLSSEYQGFFDSDFTNFLYIGTMPTGYYNEKLFIDFINVFKDEYVNNKPVRFVFIGFSGDLKDQLQNDYSDIVYFYPKVSHEVSLSLMQLADVSLFFAYDAPDNAGIVSTKIFEQIKSCTPILPFSIKKGSDIDYLLNKYCEKSLYINSYGDLLGIKDSLLEKLPRNTKKYPFLDIEHIQNTIIRDFISDD